MSESNTPTDAERENAHQIFSELGNSFNAMMGAKAGKLDTPMTFETSVGGTRAETEGSIRHICDTIEEAGHGYETSYEHLGTSEPLPSSDERHNYELRIEDARSSKGE